jgi:DNA-binding transcriptional LysR family regulator
MGLAILPRYVAEESLRANTVKPLLTDFALPAQEMHAVFPSPKLVPSKVSSFISFLEEQFTPEWWKRQP